MLNYQRYRTSSSRESNDRVISQLGQVAERSNSVVGNIKCLLTNLLYQIGYRQTTLVSYKQWSLVEFPGVSEVAITTN